jgi:ribosomal protein S18 acetylase RimI-like enzyme
MVESVDSGIIIRNFKPEEKKAIREISVQSSIFGEYTAQKLLNEEIIADLLTSYFIEYEPQFCFVAEKDSEVVGYLLGSSDVQKMYKVVRSKIMPGLVKKAFQSGLMFRTPNLGLMKNVLNSYFKGEFKVPDFSQEYPATLHVNISPRYRGKMIGSLLVYHFLQILKEKQVKGIHFGVLSDKAKRFFEKLGFEILFSGEYTFLRYLSGETLPHYIMGKKL